MKNKQQKELCKKYINVYALKGNMKKLWLCANDHLFEKTSKQMICETCPECGAPSYQPSSAYKQQK